MTDAASEAAAILIAARAGAPLAALPAALRPATRAAAYAIQHKVAASLGPIGGWKVSPFFPQNPEPEREPICGPMPAAGLRAGPASLGGGFRLRGIEAELAVRLGQDLPTRANPYSRQEVAAAIATLHPAIELIESRFVEPNGLPLLTLLADTQSHGGFVHGPGLTAWQDLDLTRVHGTQTVNGALDAERTGHPGGDLLGQVVWLANIGSAWAGGLKAGQFITCGSWTGANRVPAAAAVRVAFSDVGEVAAVYS